MQQHVSDTETPKGSSNQVETHRLTMLMQAVFQDSDSDESSNTYDSNEEPADVLRPKAEETRPIARKMASGPKDLLQLPSYGTTQPVLRPYPYHIVEK